MQTIREIRTVWEEQIVLNLPNIFRGQKVQIIVIPVQNERHFRKKSLRGCLQEYAMPERIADEEEAWQEAVREKHADR